MQILIDSGKKYFTSIATGVSLAVLGSVWAVFVRPQIVMASDLAAVVSSVEEVKQDITEIKDSVNQLAKMQCLQQRYYFQDQIRVLDVAAVDRPLTAVETQRKIYYQNNLSSLQCE